MKAHFSRRGAIAGAVAAVVGGAALWRGNRPAGAATPAGRFEVSRTPAEWRRILTAQQYAVLREASTERAGTSPLDKERRRGLYLCAGCALPLYSSAT